MSDKIHIQVNLGTISGNATRTIGGVPSGMTGIDIRAWIVVTDAGTYDDTDYWGFDLKAKTGNYTLSTCAFGTPVAGLNNLTLVDGVAKSLPITGRHFGLSGDALQVTFTKNGSAANLVDAVLIIEGTPY